MDKTNLEKFKKDFEQKKKIIDEITQLKKQLEEKILELMDLGIDASLYDAVHNNKDESIITLELYKNTLPKLRESDTNGIYVYLGTYKYNKYDYDGHFMTVEQVDRNDKKADFRLYQNIEQKSQLTLAITSANTFEENHDVIYPINTDNNVAFRNIMEKFIDGLVNDYQEDVVNELKHNADMSKEYVKK